MVVLVSTERGQRRDRKQESQRGTIIERDYCCRDSQRPGQADRSLRTCRMWLWASLLWWGPGMYIYLLSQHWLPEAAKHTASKGTTLVDGFVVSFRVDQGCGSRVKRTLSRVTYACCSHHSVHVAVISSVRSLGCHAFYCCWHNSLPVCRASHLSLQTGVYWYHLLHSDKSNICWTHLKNDLIKIY